MTGKFYSLLSPVLLIASIPLLVLFGHYGAQALGTSENNVSQWLPKDSLESKQYKEFLKHFKSDEFTIITWDGCTLDSPELAKFAELLREDAKRQESPFQRVTTGPEVVDSLTDDQGPNIRRALAIERLQGSLLGPDGKTTCLLVFFKPEPTKEQIQEFEKEGQKFVPLEKRSEGVEKIVEIAKQKIGIPIEQLHIGGNPVMSTALDKESSQAAQRWAPLASLTSLIIAIICLMNLRLALIACFLAEFSQLVCLGLVALDGSSMNLVLIIAPILIYVLTLSACVHICNYYRDAIKEEGYPGAPLRGLRMGWKPCVLSALTTAIGMGSLYVSRVIPIKDFGKYSAWSILITTVLLVLILLPAAIQASQDVVLWLRRKLITVDNCYRWIENLDLRVRKQFQTADNREPAGAAAGSQNENAFISWLAQTVLAHSKIIVPVCMVIFALLAFGALSIQTNVEPANFLESDHKAIRDLHWMEENLAPLAPIEIVVRFKKTDLEKQEAEKAEASDSQQQGDTEEESELPRPIKKALFNRLLLVRDIQDYVRQLDRVGGAMSAVTFFRDVSDFQREERVNGRLSLREVGRRAGLATGLANHLDDFKENHYVEEDQDYQYWRISTRIIRAPGGGYDVAMLNMEKELEKFVLYEKLQKLIRDGKLQQFLTTEKLRELIANNQLQTFIAGNPQLQELIEHTDSKLASEDIVLTGIVPILFGTQHELLAGLGKSFALAFLIIAVVMVVLLKSFSAGIASMLPNVFPSAVIFGTMGWMGWSVDVGAVMTASVALGIAVDDTLHFLTWFRRGIDRGETQQEAICEAFQRCAAAMTQTTLIAGLGLFVFFFSSFQPMSQFGLLMFLLLVAALVGDLIFLPALLATRIGRLFRPHSEQSTPPSSESVQTLSSASP